MLYTYDVNRIKFNRISLSKYFIFLILPIMVVSLIVFLYGYKTGINTKVELLSQEEKILLIESIDPFSENKLVEMMVELGIKFPYIPLAQSKLETGNWKSSVFIENHNLFGMKEATRRVSTAKGSNKGHAYYDTWRESVYDYAFYQCRYLGNIKTESEYFQYLSATYAEDTAYVDKLKRIIQNEGLKEKFK
jgi:hypothetical protein